MRLGYSGTLRKTSRHLFVNCPQDVLSSECPIFRVCRADHKCDCFSCDSLPPYCSGFYPESHCCSWIECNYLCSSSLNLEFVSQVSHGESPDGLNSLANRIISPCLFNVDCDSRVCVSVLVWFQIISDCFSRRQRERSTITPSRDSEIDSDLQWPCIFFLNKSTKPL